MSQVCALWNFGSKGQRSRSQCKDYWKWFLAHNCFCFSLMFIKLHMQSYHESSMHPVDFGVKVQGHIARIAENGFKHITASPLHLSSWNFTCSFPMSQVCALWNFGSKGQGHNARITENGFWRITASAFHWSSLNFSCSLTMSRVWTL